MRCGSADVRIPTTRDGVVANMTEQGTLVCARCEYRGPEILFETEAARAAFERAQGRREP
jgi:hypothetical protein